MQRAQYAIQSNVFDLVCTAVLEKKRHCSIQSNVFDLVCRAALEKKELL